MTRHPFRSSAETKSHAQALRSRTDADWSAYWKAYDARLELDAHDRRAERDSLSDLVERDLTRESDASLCPRGNPYAGRP